MPSHNCIIMKNNVQFSRCIFVEIKSTTCVLKCSISKLDCGFVSPLQSKPATLGFWLVFTKESLKRLNETLNSFRSSLLQSISFKKWWAKMDSNHRPHDYQSCALASWAIGPYLIEIKSTICVLKSQFQNSPVALFLLSESNPLRWALLRYHFFGGEYRDRTGDLLLARQALSQLS